MLQPSLQSQLDPQRTSPEDYRSTQKSASGSLRRSQSIGTGRHFTVERKTVRLGYHSRLRGASKEPIPAAEESENTVRAETRQQPQSTQSAAMNMSSSQTGPRNPKQASFREEFEKFKAEKELVSPATKKTCEGSPYGNIYIDFSLGEIKWLNELRASALSPAEKINLLENEIINQLDMNNELRSELSQTRSKFLQLSANMRKVRIPTLI